MSAAADSRQPGQRRRPDTGGNGSHGVPSRPRSLAALATPVLRCWSMAVVSPSPQGSSGAEAGCLPERADGGIAPPSTPPMRSTPPGPARRSTPAVMAPGSSGVSPAGWEAAPPTAGPMPAKSWWPSSGRCCWVIGLRSAAMSETTPPTWPPGSRCSGSCRGCCSRCSTRPGRPLI
jgi:hypothetical protein